jgi:hypothetical protein
MPSNIGSIDIPVGRGVKLDAICWALDLVRNVYQSSTREKSGIIAHAATGASLAARPRMDFPTLLQRVRSEFNEMPGLRLTPAQAGRLLGLDAKSCQRVLSALVQSAFLRWAPDGTVVRSES